MSIEDVVLVATTREEIRDGILRVDVADIPRHIANAGTKERYFAEPDARNSTASKAKLDAVEAKAESEASETAKAEHEAKANAEAEARNNAEVEAREKWEAETKAEELARCIAEVKGREDLRWELEWEAEKSKAKAEAEARDNAKAEARERWEAEASAKTEADAKVADEARAKAAEAAIAKTELEAKKNAEKERLEIESDSKAEATKAEEEKRFKMEKVELCAKQIEEQIAKRETEIYKAEIQRATQYGKIAKAQKNRMKEQARKQALMEFPCQCSVCWRSSKSSHVSLVD